MASELVLTIPTNAISQGAIIMASIHDHPQVLRDYLAAECVAVSLVGPFLMLWSDS